MDLDRKMDYRDAEITTNLSTNPDPDTACRFDLGYTACDVFPSLRNPYGGDCKFQCCYKLNVFLCNVNNLENENFEFYIDISPRKVREIGGPIGEVQLQVLFVKDD